MDFDEQPDAGNTDVMISVRNLAAQVDGRPVLRDVSFDVLRGEVFVIAGGSGSGKSTLLKHLIGLYRPAGGSVEIDGVDIHRAAGSERRRLLRRFGVAYQGGALFGSRSVLENVCLPLEEFTALPSDAIRMIALGKLRLVKLEEVANRMPAQLSGGMQKRAALARALALDPSLVFLDEPSAGLDPVTSAGLDRLLLDLRSLLKTTFVVVTHELASIFTIADRVLMLDAKRQTVAALGSPTVLRDSNDPPVSGFFNRRAE